MNSVFPTSKYETATTLEPQNLRNRMSEYAWRPYGTSMIFSSSLSPYKTPLAKQKQR